MQTQKQDFETALRRKIDGKTKPRGALGRLESLAAQIAQLQQSLCPQMASCGLAIFAGDHGIAAEGVSAYPQTVTRQMVANFLDGGAAATVFARSLGVGVTVVDCGVAGGPLRREGLIDKRLGDGCFNSALGPAMNQEQCRRALTNGGDIVEGIGADAMCFGEMGIANSSAAALVCGKIFGLDAAALAGRGTGLDDAGLAHKRAVIARAAARTPARLPALEALTQYGGFEIATMAGAMMALARDRRIVVVDGFIATAAAAVAIDLAPETASALVYGHRSAEAGHGQVLELLGAAALLDLGLRLGEGTGALMAWPLVKAAVAMLNEMASFDGAGVSGPV